MPITDGNDTIIGSLLTTNVDGLAGDDLLVLDYSSGYLGYDISELRVSRLEDGFLNRVIYGIPRPEYPGYPSRELISFSITNVERVYITGSNAALNYLSGGAGDDTLRGGLSYDELNAGLGANYVFGGGTADMITTAADAKPDHLYGGHGNDTIFGAGYNDIASGGGGNDLLVADFSTAAARMNIDANSTSWHSPNWTDFERFGAKLTPFNDVLRIAGSVFYFDGGEGHDRLIFDGRGTARVYLNANGTNNSGFETIWATGSDDIDNIHGSIGRDRLFGGDGNDTLFGHDGNDALSGGNGNDSLYGGAGTNLLIGGAGDDWIFSASQSDRVSGGPGRDKLYFDYADLTGPVTLRTDRNDPRITRVEEIAGNLTAFDDTVVSGGPGDFAVGPVYGGEGFDRLILDYSQLPGTAPIRAKFAYDTPFFVADIDPSIPPIVTPVFFQFEQFTVTTGNGSDVLSTGAGDDFLSALGGNDTLTGGLGRNTFFGGDGDDLVYLFKTAQDTVYGGNGDDSIRYERGQDTIRDDAIFGGAGFDKVHVELTEMSEGVSLTLDGLSANWTNIEAVSGSLTPYDDSVILRPRNDDRIFLQLDGGDGIDSIKLNFSYFGGPTQILFEGLDAGAASSSQITLYGPGFEGKISYFRGFENVYLRGSIGNDTLRGSLQSDTLLGAGGDDDISGAGGDDNLSGGDGSDFIWGGQGNDLIGGNDGDDFVLGDAGDDTMFGGLGVDLFIFAGDVTSGTDIITDFSALDDALFISGGRRSRDVILVDQGFDKVATWAAGHVTLTGQAGLSISLLFDSDFT